MGCKLIVKALSCLEALLVALYVVESDMQGPLQAWSINLVLSAVGPSPGYGLAQPPRGCQQVAFLC